MDDSAVDPHVYPVRCYHYHMHEILAGIKKDEGIFLLWQEGGTSRTTLFTYGELIEQSVNVLDLLENPANYALDEEHHRVVTRR